MIGRLDGGAGEAGEGKDRGVLRMLAAKPENAERRERESDFKKNGVEEPLEEAAQNAGRLCRGETSRMNLHLTPIHRFDGV